MTSGRRFLAVLILLLGLPIPVRGALRPEHRKLGVSYYFIQPNASGPVSIWTRWPNASEPAELRSLASWSADYQQFEIFEVALNKVEAFLERMKSIGFREWNVTSLDQYGSWGGMINTRSPQPVDPALTPRANYRDGEYGLYMIRAAGYWKEEWTTQLKDLGVIRVSYYPELIGTTPELARQVYELPWVQFVEPFHPPFKSRPTLTGEPLQYMAFELANIPGMQDAKVRVQARGLGLQTSPYPNVVKGFFEPQAIDQILLEPTVIGRWDDYSGIIVSAPPPGGPSPPAPPALIPAMQPVALLVLACALAGIAWWTLALRN